MRWRKLLYPFTWVCVFFCTACTGLPPNPERVPSFAVTDTASTYWGQFAAAQNVHAGDQSALLLLDNGVDALAARLALVARAESSIDVQYYLFHDDLVGRLLLDRLYAAADSGVRVRLLLDDMALDGLDEMAAILDYHPNMEVRVFNPFNRRFNRVTQMIATVDMGRVTRRMHNKAFIVDNQAVILGSRNIGDSYFGADARLDFQDLDVLAIGPAAHQVSRVFDVFWNCELAYPITALWRQTVSLQQSARYREDLKDFLAGSQQTEYQRIVPDDFLADVPGRQRFSWQRARTELLYDLPEKILNRSYKMIHHLAPQLSPLFKTVQRDLLIVSPYFIPGRQGVEFLQQLAARGVRVRILTNSLSSTDVRVVHSGYARYRKVLLSSGIELYELNKNISRAERKLRTAKGPSMTSLHTKAIVFDRSKVFIGSLNMDLRAIEFNTEIGVVLSSPTIAAALADWFDDNLPQTAFRLELEKNHDGMGRVVWHGIVDGRPQVFTREPYSNIWHRLGIGLMSILPLESHL